MYVVKHIYGQFQYVLRGTRGLESGGGVGVLEIVDDVEGSTGGPSRLSSPATPPPPLVPVSPPPRRAIRLVGSELVVELGTEGGGGEDMSNRLRRSLVPALDEVGRA